MTILHTRILIYFANSFWGTIFYLDIFCVEIIPLLLLILHATCFAWCKIDMLECHLDIPTSTLLSTYAVQTRDCNSTYWYRVNQKSIHVVTSLILPKSYAFLWPFRTAKKAALFWWTFVVENHNTNLPVVRRVAVL